MEPTVLQAIQTVGFPIVSAVSIAGFMAFVIKDMMARRDKEYEDHRTDMKDLFIGQQNVNEKFVVSLDRITDNFEKHTSQNEERYTSAIELINNNHSEIVNVLADIKKDQSSLGTILKEIISDKSIKESNNALPDNSKSQS